MADLKPGWLARQSARVERDVEQWPNYMKEAAGFEIKTPAQGSDQAKDDQIEQLKETLHSLLPGLKQLAETKYIKSYHVCAECKSNLTGCRNGDLYCDKCKSWTDPDEESEKYKIIKKHPYTDWANAAIKMIELI